MWVCEECRKAKKMSSGFQASVGPCELCDEVRMCRNV